MRLLSNTHFAVETMSWATRTIGYDVCVASSDSCGLRTGLFATAVSRSATRYYGAARRSIRAPHEHANHPRSGRPVKPVVSEPHARCSSRQGAEVAAEVVVSDQRFAVSFRIAAPSVS